MTVETHKINFGHIQMYQMFWYNNKRYTRMPRGTIYDPNGPKEYNALCISMETGKEEYVYFDRTVEVECGAVV